jgi:hypothetical protein
MTLAKATVTEDQDVPKCNSSSQGSCHPDAHRPNRAGPRSTRSFSGQTRKPRAGAAGLYRAAGPPALVSLGARSDLHHPSDCRGPTGAASPPRAAGKHRGCARRLPAAANTRAGHRQPDAAGGLKEINGLLRAAIATPRTPLTSGSWRGPRDDRTSARKGRWAR